MKKDMRFGTWNVRRLQDRCMDLGKIGIDGLNWIRLAQDRVQWRAFLSTVMNLRTP
jgi:hypothetical protein